MTKKLSKKVLRDNLQGYLFILPLLVYFLVFQLLPMVMALSYSFMEWDGFSDMKTFVGFHNYIALLTQEKYYLFRSLLVTLEYMAMSIPLSLICAVVVGAVLNSKIKGERFFKTAFYIPSVTVGVAISSMWMFMLDPAYGFINQILGTNINFLGTKALALPTLAIMSVWGGLGYNVLIMLSAMKNIDTTLYEAAEIDGANVMVRFFRITIPSVMPTIFFILITSMIGSFQVFDQVNLMTGGGPQHATYTYMFGVYKIMDKDIGLASAMSYILFLIIMVITFIQFKVVPQGTDDDKRGKKDRKNKRAALRLQPLGAKGGN